MEIVLFVSIWSVYIMMEQEAGLVPVSEVSSFQGLRKYPLTNVAIFIHLSLRYPADNLYT